MNSTVKFGIVLTIITVIAGVILSQAYEITKEPIETQRREELLRALTAVLPEFDNKPSEDIKELNLGKDKKGKDIIQTFYIAKKGDEISGAAFKMVSPEGYAGNIEVMMGVGNTGEVTGVEILNHSETPGLGDKIGKNKAWREAFKGRTLENTNWSVKKDSGDIDQFAGATISPRAVTKAVKEGLELYKKEFGK